MKFLTRLQFSNCSAVISSFSSVYLWADDEFSVWKSSLVDGLHNAFRTRACYQFNFNLNSSNFSAEFFSWYSRFPCKTTQPRLKSRARRVGAVKKKLASHSVARMSGVFGVSFFSLLFSLRFYIYFLLRCLPSSLLLSFTFHPSSSLLMLFFAFFSSCRGRFSLSFFFLYKTRWNVSNDDNDVANLKCMEKQEEQLCCTVVFLLFSPHFTMNSRFFYSSAVRLQLEITKKWWRERKKQSKRFFFSEWKGHTRMHSRCTTAQKKSSIARRIVITHALLLPLFVWSSSSDTEIRPQQWTRSRWRVAAIVLHLELALIEYNILCDCPNAASSSSSRKGAKKENSRICAKFLGREDFVCFLSFEVAREEAASQKSEVEEEWDEKKQKIDFLFWHFSSPPPRLTCPFSSSSCSCCLPVFHPRVQRQASCLSHLLRAARVKFEWSVRR